MDLQKARTQAQYLTNFRKVDHVLIENGNNFFVEMAKNFKGKPYETSEYKEPVEDAKAETKVKKESKKIQDFQDMPGIIDQEVL